MNQENHCCRDYEQGRERSNYRRGDFNHGITIHLRPGVLAGQDNSWCSQVHRIDGQGNGSVLVCEV